MTHAFLMELKEMCNERIKEIKHDRKYESEHWYLLTAIKAINAASVALNDEKPLGNLPTRILVCMVEGGLLAQEHIKSGRH